MTHPRPFRFGTGAYTATSAAEYCEQVRRVEAQGYNTIGGPDHFGMNLAPGPMLTAAALITTSARVSCTVYDNDFRHPALLAKETASIDVLSDGRLEVGIGAGWIKAEYDKIGIPFDPPGIRVERMQEAVHVIKGLWADGPFSYTGRHYTITDLDAWPKPIQRPGPPLFIGAGGKRLLSFAAREANIIGIIAQALPEGGLDTASDSEDRLARQVGWVHEAAGDRFAGIELSMLFWEVRVTEDPRVAADEIARTRFKPTTPEQVLASPYYLIGTIESMTERLQELRERFGVSYFKVLADSREAFAPVVARLKGS